MQRCDNIMSFLYRTRRIVTDIPSSAIVVTESDLLRIKHDSVIRTEAEVMAEREYARKLKEEKEKKSHDRKARMKELEVKAALLAKKSDIEIEQEAKENALRALAAEKLDKNSDTVKLLTSMSCKASAYSLRDSQVADKHSREAAEAEYNRRMDIVMEIDRLKDLHRREEEERVKAKKRVEDRKVISFTHPLTHSPTHSLTHSQVIDFQIAERQRMKIIDAEKRGQENQAMLALMNKVFITHLLTHSLTHLLTHSPVQRG